MLVVYDAPDEFLGPRCSAGRYVPFSDMEAVIVFQTIRPCLNRPWWSESEPEITARASENDTLSRCHRRGLRHSIQQNLRAKFQTRQTNILEHFLLFFLPARLPFAE